MDLFSLLFFYKPDSIAHILALVDFTSQFIVTMPTNNKPEMLVTTELY